MKKVFLTGATDGLGKALAKDLAIGGYSLVLHGRNENKLKILIEELKAINAGIDVKYYLADFSSLDDIRSMCDEIITNESGLDIIVNNAGLGVETSRRVSVDGHELVFQVNVLASYMIINKLHGLLKNSVDPRIINVSSAGQASINFDDVMLEKSWSGSQSYCQSKLALVMLAMEYAEKLKEKGITVNAVHPASMMPTKIVTHMFTPMSTLSDGVKSLKFLIDDLSVSNVTGKYFFETDESRADGQAYDEDARKALIGILEELTDLKF